MVKCYFCNKKVKGIFINITCDCNNIFCSKHYHKHSHDCKSTIKIDKTINKLKNDNPKIVSKKLI